LHRLRSYGNTNGSAYATMKGQRMTHGKEYRWGQRPPDYQPPDPPVPQPEPERVGNRLAVPHEAVVLARARAASLAAETAGLFGGLLTSRPYVTDVRLDPRIGDVL
jgi:hypothetical protein